MRGGLRGGLCAARTNLSQVKKESASSRLRAVAQIRIDQHFVSAVTETGSGLPPNVLDDVRNVLCGPHKTFRYMLVTGLLAAVSDKNLHPRCLQVNAGIPGAFDARSLCQKVVVPFEKKMLNGRLGASNEPFANKSARFDMIRKTNNVRKGADQKTLYRLYDVLEYVRTANEEDRARTFRYALSVILKLPPSQSSVTALPSISATDTGSDAFFDFLESRTKGVSAVATLAAAYRTLYTKPMRMHVHPATESGASSREVGDIDIELQDGRRIAVEVKDKPYTDVDVNHACEKALAAGVGKVIFAVGTCAEKTRVQEGALIDVWAEKGIELSFLRISGLLGAVTAISSADDRHRMASDIGKTLDEMNAPMEVKNLFARIFKKGES